MSSGQSTRIHKIQQIVDELLDLRHEGRIRNGTGKKRGRKCIRHLCLFHDEKTPSADFWPDEAWYYCHPCRVAYPLLDVFGKLGIDPPLVRIEVNVPILNPFTGEELCTYVGTGYYSNGQISGRDDRRQEPVTDEVPVIELVRLSDVDEREITWVWQDRLPRRTISIIAGPGGEGKSWCQLWVAARLTRGVPLPDDYGFDMYEQAGIVPADATIKPTNVLLLSAEDTAAEVIRGRFIALEGDADRLYMLDSVGKEKRVFSLSDDIAALEVAVQQVRPGLVMIDPLSTYFHSAKKKLNAWSEADVRSVMQPLVELAEQCDIAIWGVMHHGKSARDRMVHKIMNSVAFPNLARSVMHYSSDPKEDNSPERHLVADKHNWAPMRPASLKFELCPPGSTLGNTRGRLVFRGYSEVTAEQLNQPVRSTERQPREKAKQFLREVLSGGMMLVKDVIEAAEQNGITKMTLERAADDLKVERERRGGGSTIQWAWRLFGQEIDWSHIPDPKPRER